MRGGVLLTAAAVGVLASVVHWSALSAKALFLDDQSYLVENGVVQTPGWASAARFLGEVRRPSTVAGYYHPLPMISLMLDYARGGRAANLRPFRETSLALHGFNAALVVLFLWLCLRNLPAAAAGGLIFGLHPLNVESVVWLAERKTLLATFFALLTLMGYVAYARAKGGAARWFAYAAAVLAFALALLSKPTCTPLPVLLLLLDWWPLKRFAAAKGADGSAIWRLLLEKLPFVALAMVSAVITVISQGAAGEISAPQRLGLLNGLLLVGYCLMFYLRKFFWPVDLSAHYPVPAAGSSELVIGLVGTLIIAAALILMRRRARPALVGVLFLFIAALPTMGLIGFTNVLAADKYMYFPMLGLILALSAGVRAMLSSAADGIAGIEAAQADRPSEPAGRTARGRRSVVRSALIIAAPCVLAVLALLAHQRLHDWQTTEGIYRNALERAPRDVLLNTNLALELSAQGRRAEAVRHYEAALAVDPRSWRTHGNLAIDLAELGRIDEAIWHNREAMRLEPRIAPAIHNNLGWLFWTQKRLAEAAIEYRAALRLAPQQPEAHTNLGQVLAAQGRVDEAIAEHHVALRLLPDFAVAHRNLGEALALKGDAAGAEAAFRAALRSQPSDAEAAAGLARLLMERGDRAAAAQVCRETLRHAPQNDTLTRLMVEAEAGGARP